MTGTKYLKLLALTKYLRVCLVLLCGSSDNLVGGSRSENGPKPGNFVSHFSEVKIK